LVAVSADGLDCEKAVQSAAEKEWMLASAWVGSEVVWRVQLMVFHSVEWMDETKAFERVDV